MFILPTVGNVPYNMGEVRDRYPHVHQLVAQIVCSASKDQLIDAFKSVGPVIGFRYSSQAWQNDVYMMLKVIVITIPYQTCLRPRYWKAQRLRFL